MKSAAVTVTDYLSSLTPDRREAIAAVRTAIRRRLPKGFKEQMQYGMISWVVPLSLYPAGYLGKKDVPLPHVALASQKNHMAVYLMNVYGDHEAERRFRAAYKKSGKKLDMGRSCIRFRNVDDLALDVIGDAVAGTSVREAIASYERARAGR
jgi:hypothetical protein